MGVSISIHPGNAYLLVVATGDATGRDALALYDQVASITLQKNLQRALLDIISVNISMSLEEHVAAGVHAAATLGHLDKLAIVVSNEFRVGVGEKAARDGGLNVRSFTDIGEASNWIVS